MASTIRIKRSGTAGNPTTLASGELAYSAADSSTVQGGERLYVGFGTETDGNAASHLVIGGEFFTKMLDHSKGVLTANSALITDSDSKLNNIKVDNLDFDGNTISATDADGNIILSPSGSGRTVVGNLYINDGTTERDIREFIEDVTGDQLQGETGAISVTYDDANSISTIDLVETGVTAGSYGSTTQIPTFTVDENGRLEAAGEVNVATDLAVSGDFGTATVDLLTDTLGFVGGTSVTTTVSTAASGSADTVQIDVADASTTSKGIASFDSNNFTVSSGAVSAKDITLGTSTLTIGSTTNTLAGLQQLDVDDVRIDGNEIGTTNTDGDLSLNPNGTGNVSVNSSRITNISEPVDPQDAATKSYVDARAAGLDPKESVRVASTTNIDLSTELINGFTVDGVTVQTGDRVLLKDQSDATENGVYIVAESGAASRAPDFDEPEEVTSGVFFFIEEGATYDNAGFVLTSDGGQQQVGVDDINFVQFSGAGQIEAGDGLGKSGDTLFVNTANGIEISNDNVQLASSVAGFGLSYNAGVLNVNGTTDRISVDSNSIDIASNYAGQTSITTLGTITAGTWEANIISPTYGGTGTNNGTNVIELEGDLATFGPGGISLASTGPTNVTLPENGTLATLSQTETFTNKTINNSDIGVSNPGTGNFTALEADTVNITDTTNSTSTTTGALTVAGGAGIDRDVYIGEDLIGSGASTSEIDGFTIDGGTY